jgi:cell division protein FtsW
MSIAGRFSARLFWFWGIEEMRAFSRADSRHISRWFWEVDRMLLALLMLLIGLGLVLVLGASGPQAHRLMRAKQVVISELHFFNRQVGFALLAVASMIAMSFVPRLWIKRGAAIVFPIFLIAIGATLIFGDATKGASRWIPIFGFPFQPSEFMKPCLAVLTAWLLSSKYDDPNAPAFQVSLLPVLGVIGLLILQPDFGQTMLVITVWLAQAMLAGLPLFYVGLVGTSGVSLLAGAYVLVPHVRKRFEAFFNPDSADTYQVDKALEAFNSGGLFGVGPAEGAIKWQIPDAHTDYIFAVAGEEFGMFACAMLVLLYLAIIWRAAKQQITEDDPFVFLAVSGLVVQFGAQAFINMGVNVALLPSKGMTLPFISYGGSSMLAMAISMGMILALSRRNRFMRGAPTLRSKII